MTDWAALQAMIQKGEDRGDTTRVLLSNSIDW